jgi:hypothetical protein
MHRVVSGSNRVPEDRAGSVAVPKPSLFPENLCGAERDRTVGLLNAIHAVFAVFPRNLKLFQVPGLQINPPSPTGTGNDNAASGSIQEVRGWFFSPRGPKKPANGNADAPPKKPKRGGLTRSGKHVHFCKVCGEPGHNRATCPKLRGGR